MSDCFMMRYFLSSTVTSVPAYLPYRTSSPTLTSIGSSFLPGPTATTVPCCGTVTDRPASHVSHPADGILQDKRNASPRRLTFWQKSLSCRTKRENPVFYRATSTMTGRWSEAFVTSPQEKCSSTSAFTTLYFALLLRANI